MKTKDQPENWKCPACGKYHTKAHWPDYHQEEPNWRDKIGQHNDEKNSDPGFRLVCETCGDPLTANITNDHDAEISKLRFCKTCNEPRAGIPAPLFCPHCGWTETERVVIVRT